MTTIDIAAIISSFLTFAGVIITVYFSNKRTAEQIRLQAETTRLKNQEQADLTRYRIDQLETKVDQHNQVITRTFILEQKVSDLERIVTK